MRDILVREIKLLLYERRMVFFVLLCASSAYALLIGNLYQGHIVQNISVAVCDLDDSSLSRNLIRDIRSADQYRYIGKLASEEAVDQALQEGRTDVVLIIPAGFARDIYTDQPVSVGFLTNGSNTLQQGYAMVPMQAVISNFGAVCAVRSAAIHGVPLLPAVPVQLSIRMVGNPTQSYAFFYLYGVMLTAAQIGLMVSFALSVHGDFHNHYMQRRGFWRTLLVKELFYNGVSLFSIFMGLAIITGGFQMPFHGGIKDTFILCISFTFVVTNLAGILALYFRTELALVQCLVFYTLPAFMLSGYIWPEIGMMPLFQWISWLIPIHYAAIDFRDLALLGNAAGEYRHAAILVGVGILELSIMKGLYYCQNRCA